jgi:hypothetical protein
MHRTIKLLIAVVGVIATVAGAAVAATTPTVSTGKATSIQDNSAVLNGTVNPNGTTSFYHFEWGLTTAYGVTSSLHSVGSGTKALAVKTTAGQLIPGTVYHFRITALSKGGGSIGSDRTFKTAGHPPPGVATGAPSALGVNSATVTGVVNPNNQATQWFFQYGPTIQYTAASSPVQTIPATTLVLPVSAQLLGLQAGATFHYRLVAAHTNAPPQYGADATFVTYPSPRPMPRVLAKTTPRRDRSKPYVFTSSGRVTTSRFLPQAVQCTGSVTVRFFNGKRRIGSSLLALGPDCKFAGTTTFRHLPGRGKRGRHVDVTVRISFGGNPYSAPATARTETVTLG